MATRLSPTPASRPASAGYKVDISRGERIGRVSSEWFSRPDDERFLSLTELHAAVQARAERATMPPRTAACRCRFAVPGLAFNRANDNAPSHRVFVGRAEIGAAWTKESNEGRAYLGLKLDDPSFTAPIYANLFDDEDGETYNLIWSRPTRRNGD